MGLGFFSTGRCTALVLGLCLGCLLTLLGLESGVLEDDPCTISSVLFCLMHAKQNQSLSGSASIGGSTQRICQPFNND